MTPPPISVDSSESDACEAINTGYTSTVYISKDPANMGGSQVPEVGDTLYEYYPYASSLGMGWVGFTDSMMVQKAIELNSGGQIISINECSGGAGGGGGAAYSFNILSSSPTMIVGEVDPTSACSVHANGSPQTVYMQKDAGNMDTTIPEVNDFLYEDSEATTQLSDGYYAWYDTMNMQNKSIQVQMGQILSIVNCA